MPRLVVGGVTSGVGKTTIACALMAGFVRRGKRVQPFKAGPDYIDPGHHGAVAGRASRNLDSALLSPDTVRTLFDRAARTADIAIIEGVMGLYDGRTGHGDEGSTAHVAKILRAPTIVVIDAARTARTAGAIALGCVRFDQDLRILGFILNRMGSEAHGRTATEAVEAATGLPVLGVVPRDPELAIPERHLGLVPAAERSTTSGFVERLEAMAEEHLDLDRLWRLSLERPTEDDLLPPGGEGLGSAGLFPSEPTAKRVTIAVARDEAFNFYYEDNLDLLGAWGADLAFFSPLADLALPPRAQGIYIGGGFPEVFASQLAANRAMRDAVQGAARSGVPIYGECGGLMYLGRALTDLEGRRLPMAGVIPVESVMQRRRARLGYRTVRALRTSLLLEEGSQTIGHEFHYSDLTRPAGAHTAAYAVAEANGALEGYVDGNVLASYVHLHFGTDVAMARRFVSACARSRPAGSIQ